MTSMVLVPGLDAPTLTERRGRLLDAVSITENIEWQDGSNLFESYSCLVTGAKATLPCPPAFIAAPVLNAPSTATSGGTLAAGTWKYKLTATNSRGETIASNESSQVTTGATSTVTNTWSAVTGATGYKLYRTLVNGAANSEKFLISLGAVTTYVDTNAVALGTALPPTSNTAVVPVIKTFLPPNWMSGYQFAAYGGVMCKTPGFDYNNGKDKLREAFLMHESVAVAQAVLQNLFIANGTVWSAAPDITPAAGAVDPAVGVALLEQDAAAKYAGVPTIHVPRSIGALLTRSYMLDVSKPMFTTWQGAKVASDGGYGAPNSSPTGAAPAVGEQWIYATGEMLVGRSALQVSDPVPNPSTNEWMILAERRYIVAYDCYIAAIKVKIQ